MPVKNYILFFVLIIGLSSLKAAAQFESFSPTIDDINKRLKELEKPEANLPGNDFQLNDEKRRVDTEIEKYRTFSRSLEKSGKDIPEKFKKLNIAVADFFQASGALDCESPEYGTKTREISAKYRTIMNYIYEVFGDYEPDSPWSNLTAGVGNDPASKQVCQIFKNVKDQNLAELKKYIDDKSKQFESDQKENQTLKQASDNLIEALQKRQDAITKTMSSKDSQQAISSSLWLIILAIGVLSIGTIAIVLLFNDNLQIEWIASGQVIQFVTVMILLSVIMALGLANILKENTLGTLLGGIAGYVLSQGVGRAAARAVTGIMENKANPKTDGEKNKENASANTENTGNPQT